MAIPDFNGKTLLVTGLNDFVGAVLGKHILSKGYSSAALRNHASLEDLLSGPYAVYKDRVEIFQVPNMTSPGAFDKAVKGVDGIFHVASPVDLSKSSWEEVVVPAVEGTTTLPSSALKYGGVTLKSVVVTGSANTVSPMVGADPSPEYVYTEEDFQESAVEAFLTLEKGHHLASSFAYVASKVKSEQAVWQWRDEQKPSFAVSIVLPHVILGGAAVQSRTADKITASLSFVYKLWMNAELPMKLFGGGFIDVEDVAKVHLWAFENPDLTDGQRYYAVSGYRPPQAQADFLRKSFPDRKITEVIPKTDYSPGVDWNGRKAWNWYPDGRPRLSGQKIIKQSKLVDKTLDQSLLETVVGWEKYD